MISFARTQNCRRPLGFVGGIGIVLCFETDSGALIVGYIVFTGDSAVKEVAGVYLDAGFVGIDLQKDAGRGTINRSSLNFGISCCVEHPVVVKTFAVADLLVVGALNVGTDNFGITEIHGGAFNRQNLAGGHECGIDRSEIGGIDCKFLVGDRFGGVSRQIEI